MKKTINVTQHGSLRNLSILKDKILYVEQLVYRTNEVVTVITLIHPEQPIHVIETVTNVRSQIEND